MKKHFYYLSLLLGLAVSMTGFTSCCNDDDPQTSTTAQDAQQQQGEQQEQAVTPSLNLDFASIDPQFVVSDAEGSYISFTAGESLDMPFKVEPAELASQIVLTSSDPSIVEVEGLKLLAKKAGKTTITAKAGEMETAFDVVVKAAPPVDLSQLTADYTAQDGDVLTGTLDGTTQPYKISIADGATVTLKNLTINGVNDTRYQWAGITCVGDATIVLEGENTVTAFYKYCSGIFVDSNKTLTIKGTGSLTASTSSDAAGIGAMYGWPCGNIVIEGGTITASSGGRGAGIGGCENYSCGNITITGGTITATGGEMCPGIGSGDSDFASCGTITITDGVTKVTATKGANSPCSIGKGMMGSCGTVTIGGTEYADGISQSPFTYEPGKK